MKEQKLRLIGETIPQELADMLPQGTIVVRAEGYIRLIEAEKQLNRLKNIIATLAVEAGEYEFELSPRGNIKVSTAQINEKAMTEPEKITSTSALKKIAERQYLEDDGYNQHQSIY
jgi:hypothetical protein